MSLSFCVKIEAKKGADLMGYPNYTYPVYGGYNPVTPFAPQTVMPAMNQPTMPQQPQQGQQPGFVCRPVASEEEARARIEQIRKKQAELAKQKEGSKGYEQAMTDLAALQEAHQEYSEQL